MYRKRNFITLIASATLLLLQVSCEKEIIVDIPQPEIKIVIEGAIEEGQYPWVFVTKSSPFFSPVDSVAISKLIIYDATVVVSDGILTDTLHLFIDFYNFPFVKYTGSVITGQAGKTYSLKVIAEGREYTSSTTIPPIVKIDSLKFKPDRNQDTLGFVWMYIVDPDTLGNYYRVFTKRLGRDSIFIHPYPSVTDDKFFNGQFAEYSLENGRNPLEDNLYDEFYKDSAGVPRWYFRTGQTVAVKLATIDAFHYDFWYSVEQQYMTGSNPFSSPISARTNIKGGALGVWGGYGIFLDTISIPR